MRADLIERQKRPAPNIQTLIDMSAACKDEKHRRRMENKLEGPPKLRLKYLCDLASKLPSPPSPSQEPSGHAEVAKIILIGGMILAGLGMATPL